MEQNYIISVLVENKPGVLFNVSNMFRQRSFNIESITVGTIEQNDISRMTITVKGDNKTVNQIEKQLNKLIDVIDVSVLDRAKSVVREMVLVKVCTKSLEDRTEIIHYANIFRGNIIDVSPDSLIIEVTGDSDKIDAFIELARACDLNEIARTGITALSRGPINNHDL
jgi:acetolactate synthase-1/3 small subunit